MFRTALVSMGMMLLSAVALAQSTPNAKIIVIDFDRVSRESLVGKDIASQMESNRVDIENLARTVQQQLTAEEEELKKQRSIISQDAFNERVRTFQQKAQNEQNRLQEIAQQARTAMQQANLEVQRVLRPIVKDVMDAKGANLVIDKALVSTHAAGLDVTTEVVEKVDAAMPSYKVGLPDVAKK